MPCTRPLAPLAFALAAFFALALAPAQAKDREKASEAMLPISEQAKLFIGKTTAESLAGPLTRQRAAQMRQRLAASGKDLPELASRLKCTISDVRIGGVKVVRVSPETIPPAKEDRIALYLHGGGYVLKSALDATSVLMACLLRMPVYSIEYRLAPEHPFPDGLDDCMAVYKSLEDRLKTGKVVVFGGSAGGGMALAMLLQAKKSGLPMPAALGLFSPWSDLTRTGDSYYANEGRDPVLRWEGNLEYFAAAYADSADRDNPLLSPIHGEYDRFPPTLIITGTRDLFLSNSVRLNRRMRLAGVDAELRVWEAMFHGFDLMPDLPEGREARREMADFLIRAGGSAQSVSQ